MPIFFAKAPAPQPGLNRTQTDLGFFRGHCLDEKLTF